MAVISAKAESPQIGTVQDLTVGDRACYVTVTDETGETSTEFAGFDICEQDIVGKKVQLTYEPGNIVAEICNGDLDCGLSEAVMLITAAKALDDMNTDSYPSFLNDAEIIELVVGLEERKESWFGLAGLNKVEHPPEVPAELLTYRQSWKRKDPAIAPFLGFWHDSDYSTNRYQISIFPSTRPSHVCVVEFKPEWSLELWNEETQDYSYKDVISAEIFSVSLAKVGSAQLRSPELRADELAIAHTEFGLSETYPVELLPVLNEDNGIKLVAAAAQPQLPPDLPDDLRQTVDEKFAAYNCSL
ncbi:hypothetical protein Lepto7376_4197 [[Leptolyngbya] sp. PCC 7376]|nr:hypothetical protein Lepto7376_4197 [[Leptolyngbya] sp. PCC 7376]